MREIVLISDAPKARVYLKYLKKLEEKYNINTWEILYSKNRGEFISDLYAYYCDDYVYEKTLEVFPNIILTYGNEEKVIAKNYVNDESKLIIAYFSALDNDKVFPFLKQNNNANNIIATAFTIYEVSRYYKHFSYPDTSIIPLIVPNVINDEVILSEKAEELLLRKLQK